MNSTVSAVGFLALFPGFVIYHYGVNTGWWSSALGGLFGGASALVALTAVALTSMKLRGDWRRLNRVFGLFLVMLMFIFVWTFGQLYAMERREYVEPALIESLATAAIWISLIYIGAYFPEGRAAKETSLWGGAILVIFVFAHAFYTLGIPLGPFLAFYSPIEAGSTYQGVGRSVLAISVVLAFLHNSNQVRAFSILVIGAILILALGSRAHFFAICFVILTYIFLLTLLGKSFRGGILGLVITVAVAANAANIFFETRAAEIVDLSSSSSWSERMYALERSIEVIVDSPLSGDFGYYYWDSSGYAHNILSAWTQYGLLGFLLLCTLIFVSTKDAISGYLRSSYKSSGDWLTALQLNLVSLMLLITSEPIMSSVFPALAWGFTIRASRLKSQALVHNRVNT